MAETKRRNVCKKVYVNADGEDLGRSASKEAAALEFRFYEDDDESGKPTGPVLHCAFSDIPGWDSIKTDFVVAQVAMHGVAQKVGDRYADPKMPDKSPYEVASEQWGSITDGEWVAEGQSAGPRVTDLLTALCRALNKAGQLPAADPEELDDETRDKVLSNIRDDDPEVQKSKKATVGKIPEVKAEMEKILEERRIARRKAAEKAAKESGGKGLEGLSV